MALTPNRIDEAIIEPTSHKETYYDPLVVSACFRLFYSQRKFYDGLTATADRLNNPQQSSC